MLSSSVGYAGATGGDAHTQRSVESAWAAGPFPQLTRVEVPCRATGLTLASPTEHREISGCLPGVLPPVSALGNPSGDGWNKAERSQRPFL